MKFGRIKVNDAEGAILAHSLTLDKLRLKKGHRINRDDINALKEKGCISIVAAQLEDGDLDEDSAGARVAETVRGEYLAAQASYGGRVNLYATEAGLLVYDQEQLDRVNMIDEAITVAVIDPCTLVDARQVVATIKIIPYGVAKSTIEKIEAVTDQPAGLLRIARFKQPRIGLVQTRLPGSRESILNKTRNTLEKRLQRLGGSSISVERRCDHEEGAIAGALDELREAHCDLFLISGASATADRRDVVPMGLTLAGGEVTHLGMPAEPGNLLLLGAIDSGKPLIGLPGCARSPALNGVDWVLERILAGLDVGSREIMCMGAGGYIKGKAAKKVTVRSRPAEENGEEELTARAPRIWNIVLAAGMSRRMGKRNKLLERVDGEAMVRKTVRQSLASQVEGTLVVTGHDKEAVRAALDGLEVETVDNPDYADGLSTSLLCGLQRLPDEADAALICLADMPAVDSTVINQLLAAYNEKENRLICVPVFNGKRGNPVLLARRFFPEMTELSGDRGARDFLQRYTDLVCEVEIQHDGILRDIDDADALQDYRENRS